MYMMLSTCVATGTKLFSPEVVAILENLYYKGMMGWGENSEHLEYALKSTSLSLTQVKVCVLYGTNKA